MSHGIVEVGELLRSLREAAGFTQEQLAHAINCSKAQLSLMESGQRSITPERAGEIEKALRIKDGRLAAALQWHSTPPEIRRSMQSEHQKTLAMSVQLRKAMTSADPVKALRKLLKHTASNIDAPIPLGSMRGIPLINKVAAGYPADFTDLDYPVRVADEYVTCPDVSDPDAFAARVVGDSMEPEYHQGDIVIFSPMLDTPPSSDCFVRLERDSQTTFKRIYFEDGGKAIRLQPLNNAYRSQIVPREEIAGIYAAAFVIRRVETKK
jgi:repressor LexA